MIIDKLDVLLLIIAGLGLIAFRLISLRHPKLTDSRKWKQEQEKSDKNNA